MTSTQKSLPIWILIVSSLFAIMEIGVGLFFYPQSIADKFDLNTHGVNFFVGM